MLHCDTTPFIDDSLIPSSVSTTGTGVSVDNSIYVFGNGAYKVVSTSATPSFLFVTNTGVTAFAASNFTFNFRFYCTDTNNFDVFFMQEDTITGGNTLNIYRNSPSISSGRTFFIVSSAGTYHTRYYSDIVISPNTWYTYAFVRDSSDIRFYVNGNTQSVVVTSAIGTNVMPNIAGDLQFGRNSYNNNVLGMWMDEIRISNTLRYTGNYTVETTAFSFVPVILEESRKRMSRLSYDNMMDYMMEDY